MHAGRTLAQVEQGNLGLLSGPKTQKCTEVNWSVSTPIHFNGSSPAGAYSQHHTVCVCGVACIYIYTYIYSIYTYMSMYLFQQPNRWQLLYVSCDCRTTD